jgi:hypothetical protein
MIKQDGKVLQPSWTPGEFFAFMRPDHTVGYATLGCGVFPFAIRVGRQWRIPRDAMLQWLTQEKAAGASWQVQPAANESERSEVRHVR